MRFVCRPPAQQMRRPKPVRVISPLDSTQWSASASVEQHPPWDPRLPVNPLHSPRQAPHPHANHRPPPVLRRAQQDRLPAAVALRRRDAGRGAGIHRRVLCPRTVARTPRRAVTTRSRPVATNSATTQTRPPHDGDARAVVSRSFRPRLTGQFPAPLARGVRPRATPHASRRRRSDKDDARGMFRASLRRRGDASAANGRPLPPCSMEWGHSGYFSRVLGA